MIQVTTVAIATGSSPRVRGKHDRINVAVATVGLIPARAGKTSSYRVRGRRTPAHPRACGENGSAQKDGSVLAGSSPRVRGKHLQVDAHQRVRRLIPARAGKTYAAPSGVFIATAHPRACGENPAWPSTPHPRGGSSPRVRGKRDLDETVGEDTGLIPARAGKTCGAGGGRGVAWAHPRACGENRVHIDPSGDPWGSSPRVRGKRPPPPPGPPPPGLIPARAGKTLVTIHGPAPQTAHPRACGENRRGWSRRSTGGGSSPRVRGKRLAVDLLVLRPGLIPARAGKTPALGYLASGSRAHPRACGENRQGAPELRGAEGSSPRVRGKRRPAERFRLRAGLIPARAGKTGRGIGGSATTRAHPRACGENTDAGASAPASAGSSPRVRGKPRWSWRPRGRRGLIPARAGKTEDGGGRGPRQPAHPRACGENGD